MLIIVTVTCNWLITRLIDRLVDWLIVPAIWPVLSLAGSFIPVLVLDVGTVVELVTSVTLITVAVSVVDCLLGVSGSVVVVDDGPFVVTIPGEEIPVNNQTQSELDVNVKRVHAIDIVSICIIFVH